MNKNITNDNNARKICLFCKHGHEKGFGTQGIFIDGFYCEHKKQWIEMFQKACKDFERREP